MKSHEEDAESCLHCAISLAILTFLDANNLRITRPGDVDRPAVMVALGMVAGEIVAEVGQGDPDYRAALTNGLLDAMSERIKKADDGILAHVPNPGE